MELTIQNALCQALVNAVGRVYSFYKWECPSCDLEEKDTKCTCKQGFIEFKKAQDEMFAVYKALEGEVDEVTTKDG